MIYIFTPKTPLTEFLFDNIEGIEPIFYPQSIKYNLVEHIYTCLYTNVSNKIFHNPLPCDITQRLKSINSDDKLIVIEEFSYLLTVVSTLCKEVKNKVLYLWNPLSATNISVGKGTKCFHNAVDTYLRYCENLGFRVVSFDEMDSQKANIAYYPQFYRKIERFDTKLSDNDFFFCGAEKGRIKTIEQFKSKLSQCGKCDFVVVGNGYSDPLNYNEYLERLKSSRVLCEIIQENQTGLTQRAIEALFFNKKLITNNNCIVKYDFYSEDNILIFNEATTVSQILEFLKRNMRTISNDIISKYTIQNWAGLI